MSEERRHAWCDILHPTEHIEMRGSLDTFLSYYCIVLLWYCLICL